MRNTTGITADRGTFFKDPFRKRWVFSIKGYESETNEVYGRHRMYWDTLTADPFAEDVHWSDREPVLWAAADSLDQFVRSYQPCVVPYLHFYVVMSKTASFSCWNR